MTVSTSDRGSLKTADGHESPIKVTARFQDSVQPIRHRPIIRIEGSHIVRTSVDSGRDNPFKPDGDIYKSADPIVDYYKQASNQSRPQSANDDSALIANGQKGNKRRFWRKRRDDNPDQINQTEQGKSTKKSCLRKWLCCGCWCCKCCRKNDSSKSGKRPMSKEDQEIAKRLAEIAKQEVEAQQKAKLGPLEAQFDANKEAYKEARRKFLKQQSQDDAKIDSIEKTQQPIPNQVVVKSSQDDNLVNVSVTDDVIDDNETHNKSQTNINNETVTVTVTESTDSIDKPPTVVGANDDIGDGQVVDEVAVNEGKTVSRTVTTTETTKIGEDGEAVRTTITTVTSPSTSSSDSSSESSDDQKKDAGESPKK